ncbi:MAG: hypothetical protein GY862_19870, partial [Gammaproteobacteria bacterium]|nr:hypothetical protein [Gammaproteobacteria bacterium]
MALPGLPPEMAELAREAGAFLRSRQIKSPAELMRAVFLSCGNYRIHAGINLVTLAITDIQITDKHTGETLKNFKLGQG